jgi:hypothetical protein
MYTSWIYVPTCGDRPAFSLRGEPPVPAAPEASPRAGPDATFPGSGVCTGGTPGGTCPSPSVSPCHTRYHDAMFTVAAPDGGILATEQYGVRWTETDRPAPFRIENLGSWARLDDGDVCNDETLHDTRALRQATAGGCFLAVCDVEMSAIRV